MPTLEVHQLDRSEVYRDIVRVNKKYRTDKRGKVIAEGAVALVRVNGSKKGFAVLRGYQQDESSHIRMDDVTREKLGVEDKTAYSFEFKKAWWYGQFRWAWNASEMGYRFATRIAVLGLLLGFLGLVLGALGLAKNRIAVSSKSHVIPARSNSLALDEVIAWRHKYADLIGKTRDAVLERYGAPMPDEHADWLVYRASDKTSSRAVSFALKDGKVFVVKVFKRDDEQLDVVEIVKKAPLFDFDSGTFTDTTKNYLKATTKDHRSAFQFSVSDKGANFEGVVFARSEL